VLRVVAGNGRALRCWGIWKSSARNRCPIEKQMYKKVQKMIEKLLPEPKPNSEPMLMGIASAPILQNPLLPAVLLFCWSNSYVSLFEKNIQLF
jgi:hypothetical protein